MEGASGQEIDFTGVGSGAAAWKRGVADTTVCCGTRTAPRFARRTAGSGCPYLSFLGAVRARSLELLAECGELLLHLGQLLAQRENLRLEARDAVGLGGGR